MSTNHLLLEMLTEEATNAELLAILRQARDSEGESSEIRLPRRSREVREELERAVSAGSVSSEKLIAALQDAEENGHQHIFYYLPKKGKGSALGDGETVAQAIFGNKGWHSQNRFPLLTLVPDKAFVWADFRIGLPGKPNDWVAKFYDREMREEELSPEEVAAWLQQRGLSDIDATFRLSVARQIPYRSVVMARWNHPSLLEIRVSRRGVTGRSTIALRERAVWSRINKGVPEDHVVPWDLTPVRNNMVRAETAGPAPFRTSRTNLRTAGGTAAEFHRPTHEEALSADATAVGSIVGIIDDGGGCETNTMNFLADSSEGVLDQDLLVIVGAAKQNEIVIRSEANANVVDYVTEQFRAYR